MNKFKVFKHPDGRLDTVKEGFSFPGLIFGSFWLMWHKIWGLAGLVTAVSIAVYFLFPNPVGYIYGIPYGHKFGLADIANIGLQFTVGYCGNKWRSTSLGRRGFDCVATEMAATPDGAKAKYLRHAPISAEHEPDFTKREPG